MKIIHLVMTKNLIFNIFSKNKNPTNLMLVGFYVFFYSSGYII